MSTIVCPVLLAVAPWFALGCRSSPIAAIETAPTESAALLELAERLSGHFSSAGQAERDPRFLHIELRATRIWPERTDGIWLYVEQAAGWTLDRPYRQRLYHLTETSPTSWLSEVHLLPTDEPLAFAGAWERPADFDAYEPEDAPPRTGCAIHLKRQADGTFVGRTRGTGCASALGDAQYATSSVLITPEILLSWDRGWTKFGTQAWGAESGPYLFERQGVPASRGTG